MTYTSSTSSHLGNCNQPEGADINTALAKLTSATAINLQEYQPLDLQVQHWQTAEGVPVRFVAARERPMFDLVMRFRAGSAEDGQTPGIAALTLYSLDQGIEQLDAEQFADQMAAGGAILSRAVSFDDAVFRLRSLSASALSDTALSLLTEMLARPALREADVENIRQRLLGHLSGRTRNTHYAIADLAMATLFADHPYATSSMGTHAGVSSITLEQLKAFHQRCYSTSRLDIGLVGDFSREQAQQLVATITRALPVGSSATATAALGSTRRTSLVVEKPASNTYAVITMALPLQPDSPDYPALLMFNQILGAGFESRLLQELRVRRALTYAIDSALRPTDAATLLQIDWEIDPRYREASRALVDQIIRCLCDQGPSQAECELALATLIGGFLRATADSAQLAGSLARMSHQGQPANYLSALLEDLQRLTPADVQETAKRLLDARSEVFTSIGPSVEQQPLPQPPSTDQ